MQHIVIIGNGIAGITAARHLRKRSDDKITVISAESDHFYSRTALMYIYMGHMRYEHTKPYEDWFWETNRIDLRRDFVESVHTEGRRLSLRSGAELDYDVLIVASGSSSNRFGWPGQDLRGVQGLYGLSDLESMEAHTSGIDRAVVVGGGLIGVEMAEMLCSRHIPVTFLVRETSWMDFAFPAEESQMINQAIRSHHVDLRLGTELEAILADEAGRARAVRSTGGDEIECQFVGLTVGVSPNISLLEGSGIETDRGVLVDSRLRTSAPHVYAIGDCAQLRDPAPGRRPVEPLWYTGRSMGEAVARTISGEATDYVQDLWFNSAKFFDLEWQVYGDVPASPPEGVETLYWQHPTAARAVRINYRAPDGAVLGFNLMGIRYRHEVCDRWIRQGRVIREVLAELGAANFDPELFAEHEKEVVGLYNSRHPGSPVVLERGRGLGAVVGALEAW